MGSSYVPPSRSTLRCGKARADERGAAPFEQASRRPLTATRHAAIARAGGFEPTPFDAFSSARALPSGAASLTVNGAMTSTAFISPSPMYVAPMGERRVLCTWAKLTHRATDAASGV
jgi:hypothetical protein